MRKLPLTVIVPVYNEEMNISEAINSVKDYSDQVLLVDSGSTDGTLSVAQKTLADVNSISIPFTTFARKMNEALKSPFIRNHWVMRLDADEVVVEPETFFKKLADALSGPETGFYVNRRYHFWGAWVRHGGIYPRKTMRIFRKDKACFEDRALDEKVLLEGASGQLDADVADVCRKGFLHWVRKHLQYAEREAKESLRIFDSQPAYDLQFDVVNRENKRRYYRLPVFIRPALYFFYRWLYLGGFKDGLRGSLYHFLHAFVYREVVDWMIVRRRLAGRSTGAVGAK